MDTSSQSERDLFTFGNRVRPRVLNMIRVSGSICDVRDSDSGRMYRVKWDNGIYSDWLQGTELVSQGP